jgi:hypothetical protein
MSNELRRGFVVFVDEQATPLVIAFCLSLMAWWLVAVFDTIPRPSSAELVLVAGSVEQVVSWKPSRSSKIHALLQLSGSQIRVSTEKLDAEIIRSKMQEAPVKIRALVRAAAVENGGSSPAVKAEALWLNNQVIVDLADSDVDYSRAVKFTQILAALACIGSFYAICKAYADYQDRRG